MSKKNKSGNKRVKKSVKKLLVCLLIVGLIIGGYFVYKKYFNKQSTPESPKVVDEIKTFNYAVNENDTKLFKSTFDELKKVLGEKEVDNKKYAETISKLFIIDFFTFSNKTSKNDIGGIQFVYSTYKTSFVDFARDGIYKQVKNTLEGNSNADLPTVKSVNVNSIEEINPSNFFSNIDFGENAVGYEVSLDWEYEKDTDFQSKTTLVIVKDNDKLSVAKMERN